MRHGGSSNTPVASAAIGTTADEPAGAAAQCSTCGGEFSADTSTCPRDGCALDLAAPDPLRRIVLGDTYRVLRRIAIGGMGRVYEAEHLRLPQRFAVKVIHEAQAHRTEAVQRFEREALETSRLRSEHVIEIVDFLRTPDGRPCMVTEYLEGENLQERLDRRGRLEVDEAVAVAIEICRGLATAHEHRVVHRDLKPSNVFLARVAEEREVAKLLDFGVAKVQDRRNLTQTGAFVGTPAYMAPEQAAGAEDVDHRADIYAVGAVLYHMIGGEPPYGREDAAVTLMKLLQGEPARVRSVYGSVPPALESVIEQAMAREPSARYATVGDLCAELTALARVRGRDGVLGARPAAAVADRRARWLRPSAVGLVAAAALVATVWVAALGGAVLFSFKEVAALGEVERRAYPLIPPAAGLLVLALTLRRLVTGWRSGPRVASLVARLRHALLWGLGVVALLELGLVARRAWSFDEGLTAHLEQAAVLGVAGLVGVLAFAIARARA